MKAAVALLIVAVAAVMAYMALKGECNGGTIVYSETQCLQSGTISPAACRTVLANAAEATRRGATVFARHEQCSQHFEQCVRSTAAEGFVPVPIGFCVEASGTGVAKQEPIFRRQNAGVNWNRG